MSSASPASPASTRPISTSAAAAASSSCAANENSAEGCNQMNSVATAGAGRCSTSAGPSRNSTGSACKAGMTDSMGSTGSDSIGSASARKSMASAPDQTAPPTTGRSTSFGAPKSKKLLATNAEGTTTEAAEAGAADGGRNGASKLVSAKSWSNAAKRSSGFCKSGKTGMGSAAGGAGGCSGACAT